LRLDTAYNLLAVLPFFVAFVVSMLVAPGIIAALKRKKVGQTIQTDGPESHRPKAGTPTMGGLIILAGMLASVVVIALITQAFGRVITIPADLTWYLAVVALIFAYAAVGMIDDYLTVRPQGGVRGISSKPKALAQVALAAGFLVWLGQTGFVPELRIGGVEIISGWLYWAFALVFIVGMANFVNITDGLDGLVAGLVVIAGLALSQLWPFGVVVRPGLFWIDHLLPAMAGACLAFLWFNANPAKVFMGDTGSLALGAALPAIAVATHREVLVIVVGLVFVLDGFSTMIQWAVFKYTRIRTGTGRRVFKKSPIHHHFELCGWPEQTVVMRFWICGVVAAALGLVGAIWGWW
jgi:phospho-N-acetylmuramoyl-pentapeptide-transferase